MSFLGISISHFIQVLETDRTTVRKNQYVSTHIFTNRTNSLCQVAQLGAGLPASKRSRNRQTLLIDYDALHRASSVQPARDVVGNLFIAGLTNAMAGGWRNSFHQHWVMHNICGIQHGSIRRASITEDFAAFTTMLRYVKSLIEGLGYKLTCCQYFPSAFKGTPNESKDIRVCSES